jgi:putative drug exporter of the RND superfamily
MSVAVLIDATLVRGILLPAGLSLLGDRLWRSSVPPAPERPVSPALSRQ